MKNRIGVVGAGLLVIAVASVGCGDDGAADGEGGSSGNTSAQTTGATSTSSGTVASGCTPQDGATIDPTCGIFVDGNSLGGGNGTQSAPFRTLAEAVAVSDSGTSRIYVCGSVESAPPIPPGKSLHGDLTCEWKWDFSVRTPWAAPANSIPLQIEGGVSTNVVTGFAITAADATTESGSSIAVLVNAGTLELARVDITAGDAVSGVDGIPGMNGANGGAGQNALAVDAGEGGTGGCDPGGKGAQNTGCGQMCFYDEAEPPGLGGMSSYDTCTDGLDGADGMDGTDGAHGGKGSIGPAGFQPLHGQPGTAGTDGQGAGGGGARRDLNVWRAGGGGGAGGCGATASGGGTSGGSSFAIVSLDAVVRFDAVTAQVGSGGDGGRATPRRVGGTGAMGGQGYCSGISCGMPGEPGCDGGKGGDGGDSGSGGAGAGGHAAIIAYTGVINALDGLTATPPINIQAGQGFDGAPDGAFVVELAFP